MQIATLEKLSLRGETMISAYDPKQVHEAKQLPQHKERPRFWKRLLANFRAWMLG